MTIYRLEYGTKGGPVRMDFQDENHAITWLNSLNTNPSVTDVTLTEIS